MISNREQFTTSEATLSQMTPDQLIAYIQKLEAKLSKEAGNKYSNSKLERLLEIRHGLTELTERMQIPYLVSPELQTVKESLDMLADEGQCNSVILEGEPGTGKTQWAYSEVGQKIQDGENIGLIHIRVKDTMTAQELLYTVDDVRRLNDAQTKADVPDEIKQEAAAWKRKIMQGEIDPSQNEDYKKFLNKMKAVVELGEAGKDLDYSHYIDLGPLGEAIFQSKKGKEIWLLIDEIEKGREELMTGILDEIENLTFIIAETGQQIQGDKTKLRIVITTNTEDSHKIPPSFRRRSLYHYMDFPKPSEMQQIIRLNFPKIEEDLLDYAVKTFYKLHDRKDLEKPPSTPELLAWIHVLMKEQYDPEKRSSTGIPHPEIVFKYLEDKQS